MRNEAFEEQLKVLKDLGEFYEDTRESDMKRKTFLKRNDILVQLDPFVDQSGVLRVGGHLRRSNLEDSKRHPLFYQVKEEFQGL